MSAKPWLVMSCFISVSAFAAGSSVESNVGVRVIYGDDNRLDIYQVSNSQHLALADSTVALMNSTDLTKDGGRFKINSTPVGEEMGLCSDEPFAAQPSAAFCSGSLVGEDLMMTAGHCVTSQSSCDNVRFVFGFNVTQEGKFPSSVSEEDVVGCKEIISRKQVGNGADYAIVRLTRKVKNHLPLILNRANDLRANDAIGVIGHPSGIPTKVAFGAKVRSTATLGYFTANLDTYGGNSGSAVFNEKTGLVEGILVRGEQDFVYDSARGCTRSKICTEDGCRGEDVTKVSEVLPFVPMSAGEPSQQELSSLR